MAIKFSRNARDKMTTINNKLANLPSYIWLHMVVIYGCSSCDPRGWGGLRT